MIAKLFIAGLMTLVRAATARVRAGRADRAQIFG